MDPNPNNNIIARNVPSESVSDRHASTQWHYLEKHHHSWHQQLYLKGQRIKASVIYSDMIVNRESPQQAAFNWDLPVAAIHEIIGYCKAHQDLIKLEAREERRRLEQGVIFGNTTTEGIINQT